MSYPRRGSVYLVNLDPTVGSEIRKTRPAVVISGDIMNEHSPLVIVTAITERKEPKFDEVPMRPPEGGVSKPSVIVPTQVRTVDKQRLAEFLGRCSDETMRELNTSLEITLGLTAV